MYKYPPASDISQIKAIIEAAASVWGMHPQNIAKRSRKQPRAIVRQICMALAYRTTNLSLTQVAQCFDLIDHASVIHAMKRADKATNDPEMAEKIIRVINKITPPTHCKKQQSMTPRGVITEKI